mmetsp:Transcript_69701/g.168627  ORF Transcript_69701/g.168627 Transcript_69701/m.168627 type:complete len:265 (-) Transcript_69701:81-875(-)
MPAGWNAPGSGGPGAGAGFGPGGLGGPSGGLPAEPFRRRQPQEPGMTTEELMEKFAEQREEERLQPMDGKEWRKRQEKGLKPEVANANIQPPGMAELMAQCQPFPRPLLGQGREQEEAEASPSQDELLRQQALKDLERSQMPAVAAEGGGRLVKTIEHYAFADSEDIATFYVHFDKDLWDGASKHITEAQVKVDSKAGSLEILLQGVPVSEKSQQTLADWRLTLSPLFGRVEPLMTTQKMKNGKLTVKLAKAKNIPWKKGVKYS